MSTSPTTIARSTASSLLHSTGAARALHRRVAPGSVTVLCYHGIAPAPLEVPEACFTTRARFEEQMTYLSRHFDLVHVEDAFATPPEGGRPRACVTFDDGFAGVFEHGLPVLRSLGLPATVFLVTDLIGSADTLWFAQLHRAIIRTRARAVRLDDREISLDGPEARAAASGSLQRLLKAHDADAFPSALAQVLDQLGEVGDDLEPWFRILDAEQIRAMELDDLVRFGGHSATHQILTRTTAEAAEAEVVRSVEAVRSLVEVPSTAFAYPNGGLGDFDEANVATLRALGIDLGLTTVSGPNGAGDDPYRIHRYVIGADESPAAFAVKAHHVGANLRTLRSRGRE